MFDTQSIWNAIKALNHKVCCALAGIGIPVGEIAYGKGTGITSDSYFTRSNPNTGGDGSTNILSAPEANVTTAISTGKTDILGPNTIGSAMFHSDGNTSKVAFLFAGDPNGILGTITNDACVFGRVEPDNSSRGFYIDDNGIGWGSTSTLFFKLPLVDGSNHSVLSTNGSGVLSFASVQTLLSSLPSFANDSAAATGGLSIGNSYFNTTINSYTRRLI